MNPDDSETEKEEERSTDNDKLNTEREVSLAPSPERTLMKSPRKKDEHNESMDDVKEKIKVKKSKKRKRDSKNLEETPKMRKKNQEKW